MESMDSFDGKQDSDVNGQNMSNGFSTPELCIHICALTGIELERKGDRQAPQRHAMILQKSHPGSLRLSLYSLNIPPYFPASC